MTRLSDIAEAIRLDLKQAVDNSGHPETTVCVGIYPAEGIKPEDEIPTDKPLCVTASARAHSEYVVHPALVRCLRKYRNAYDISLQVTGHA